MARRSQRASPTNSSTHLDAPVRRVAAIDMYVAYQPILEDAILPQANDLFRGMKELAEY